MRAFYVDAADSSDNQYFFQFGHKLAVTALHIIVSTHLRPVMQNSSVFNSRVPLLCAISLNAFYVWKLNCRRRTVDGCGNVATE